MHIGWWNVRGFSKALKHKIVHSFLKEHQLALCALLETKLEENRLLEVMQWNFTSWKGVHNFEEHEAGRIAILWNPQLIEVTVMGIHDQVIHLCVTCKVSSKTFYVSFVYGLHSVIARRALWDRLREFGYDGAKPWLVCGDFNNLLQLEDRIGGVQPKAYEIDDFLNCCVDLGLVDIKYLGARYTWNNGRTWSKIDRAMCNQCWLMEGNYALANFLPPGCVSDHSPCVVNLVDMHHKPRPSFMFFNMWADHSKFLEIVDREWNMEVIGTRQFSICRKLKALKQSLRWLNNQEFSHIAERAKRARASLKEGQLLLLDNPRDGLLAGKVNSLRKEAEFLMEAERKFCAQKTKTDFLLKGDKGTKLFHSLIKRNAKKNFIAGVTRADGTHTLSRQEVHREFLKFYEDLLGTHEDTAPLQDLVMEDGPLISDQQAEELTCAFSREDIRNALFDIGNDKSPGPDGYTSYFFKKSWNIVGDDLCRAVLEFFRTGKLLKQFNHCMITLIPKTTRATTVGDFRPIACCNVIYKVITKLLADRLGMVLPVIVDKAQSAFVQGRSMVENIHLAQEIMRGYGRKRTTPKCTLKIDLRKAYDTISWSFLHDILMQLRFPTEFVGWIMACVTTPSYSLRINGETVGFFKGKRGLRQGDPMSPSLFVLCMEYLSRYLNRVTTRNRRCGFNFHAKCEPLRISHLVFADDLMIFSRGDASSVQIICEGLEGFGDRSGLRANALKSNVILAGVEEYEKENILRVTGFTTGRLPFRYLGVPLSGEFLKLADFAPLLDKVTATLCSWAGLNLSYAGKIEVIKSVIQGIQSFWLGIIPISSTVLDKISAICRRFLWGGDFAKVAWNTICCGKKFGGLGLMNTKVWNTALLAKILWNIHSKKDTLWCKWIHHVYLRTTSIWLTTTRKGFPPLMKKLLEIRDSLIASQGSTEEAVQLLDSWCIRGRFQATLAYKSFMPAGRIQPWHKVVWNTIMPPKFSFTFWLATLNRMPTKDRLVFLGEEQICGLCEMHIETLNHLFFSCSFTRKVWQQIKEWTGLRRTMGTLKSSVKWLLKDNGGTSWRCKWRQLSLAATVYYLWRCRNQAIFDSLVPDTEQVVRKIKIQVYKIVFSLYPHILNS